MVRKGYAARTLTLHLLASKVAMPLLTAIWSQRCAFCSTGDTHAQTFFLVWFGRRGWTCRAVEKLDEFGHPIVVDKKGKGSRRSSDTTNPLGGLESCAASWGRWHASSSQRGCTRLCVRGGWLGCMLGSWASIRQPA
jgi:hypothetical protein